MPRRLENPGIMTVCRRGVRWARARSVAARALLETESFGPLALFLPSAGKAGASLLRIHRVAAALRPLGWRTVLLPPTLTLTERQKIIAGLSPDVLVMQGVRHALNRPQYYPGQPIVMDMDDADFHLPHLAGPLRRALPRTRLVIAGSDYVARWCRASGARSETVWTGTPVSPSPRPPQAGRPPVIAWAQTRPMTYTREADIVRNATRAIAAARPGTVLRLYDRCAGDDPGFAESFASPGLTVEWRKAMPYDRYLASFDDVRIGFAPLAPETPFSRGKSFGKVLAYLDRMVPVVASDACEHGRFFAEGTGVLSNDPEDWVKDALRLLDDPSARQSMAETAFWAFQTRLTTAAAAEQVDGLLRQVVLEARTRLRGSAASRAVAR